MSTEEQRRKRRERYARKREWKAILKKWVEFAAAMVRLKREQKEQEKRPDPEDYGTIARYNWEHNECNCPAYEALLCYAVGMGLDWDVAAARHGICTCTCHEQESEARDFRVGDRVRVVLNAGVIGLSTDREWLLLSPGRIWVPIDEFVELIVLQPESNERL